MMAQGAAAIEVMRGSARVSQRFVRRRRMSVVAANPLLARLGLSRDTADVLGGVEIREGGWRGTRVDIGSWLQFASAVAIGLW